jgi:hypothetical protein
MTAIKKILAGTVGIAAIIGAASPAAAQYYPGNGYGGYQNNSPGNVVGQVINGVIAATQYGGYQYGNYGYGQSYGYRGQNIQASVAVNQCSGAVEARLNGGGYNNGYGGYDQGSNQGYGQSYGQGGRVTGITNIEARNNGALRVHGVISTMAGGGYNQGYSQGYGYNNGYNQGYGYNNGGYGAPSLSFTCKVDYSGRVIDLSIDRNRGGYNRGYGYRGY